MHCDMSRQLARHINLPLTVTHGYLPQIRLQVELNTNNASTAANYTGAEAGKHQKMGGIC